MPPRYTYWTILFGDKPTAFRAATQEELLPTFGQIRGKHPDAVMMWFARGKLWRSEEEGRAAFAATHQKRGQPPFFAKKGDNLGRPPRPPEDGRPRDFRGPKPEWRDKPRDDNRPHDQRPPRPQWQNRDRPKTQDGRPQDFRGPKPPASARRPGGAGYGEASPKPRSGEGGPWRDKPRDNNRPPDQRPPRPEWQNKERPKTQDGRPQDFRGPKPSASARRPGDAGYGEASPKPRSGEGGPWRDKPRDNNRPRDQRPPRPEWQNKERPKTQDGRPRDFRGPKPPASARRPGGAGYGEGGEWRDRPKGDRPRGPKPAWRDKPRGGEGAEWRNKPRDDNRPRDQRPPRPPGPPASARKPTGPGYGGAPPKPAGGEGGERRGRDWRPGGEHKDPRDRFKVPRDVKRARFKAQAQRDRTTPRPPRKKKDDE
jgi:hypothetical protein